MKKESKDLKDIKVIDLFSGIGAFHLAFKSFGAKIVFASEIDKNAVYTYKENFGLIPKGDITKLDEKLIPNHDILCAGFPCQPFSISGKQEGFKDKTRGTLFFDIIRIAKEKKPSLIFLENVKNLTSHDDGRTLEIILKSLIEIGYTPFYKVLDASKYGIPQSRKRIYIVAFRNDLKVTSFSFPKEIPLKKQLKDILEKDNLTSQYIINRNDYTLIEDTNPKKNNKPLRIGTFNKGGQGERIYSPNGTAITLSANGGGIGAKTGLYYINNKIRRLSPRECARLQGFPDTFKINPNKNIAYKQFGNSIVVDVLQCIIEEIIKNEQFLEYLKNKK